MSSGSGQTQPAIMSNGESKAVPVHPAAVPNKVTVVLGAQWGDEGKGKVVDLLAQDADIVCRCQVSQWPGKGGGRLQSFYSMWRSAAQ